MRGGYRPGAGRKKGYAAAESEKAREYIVQKVGASLEHIVAALVEQAKHGDIRAIQTLFDRAYGKAAQNEPVVVNVMSQQIEVERLLLRDTLKELQS